MDTKKKIERFEKRKYWPVSPNEQAFMTKARKNQLAITKSNPAENWLHDLIKLNVIDKLGKPKRNGNHKRIKFRRQRQKGFRIYDFWSSKLKCAIEVDGKLHDKEWDAWRDAEYEKKYGIRVFRIRAFNDNDAIEAFAKVKELALSRGYVEIKKANK